MLTVFYGFEFNCMRFGKRNGSYMVEKKAQLENYINTIAHISFSSFNHQNFQQNVYRIIPEKQCQN